MRIYGLIAAALLLCQVAIAQELDKKYSFRFVGIPLAEALQRLDAQTDYQLYFQREWFATDLIDKDYNNREIEFILQDLLDGSTVNFFLYPPDKIILTNNLTIYDELPEGFFGRDSADATSLETVNSAAPLFTTRQKQTNARRVAVYRVGKQRRADPRAVYTLTGRVINEATGEPIPDMTILTQKNQLAAVTDLDGNYSMDLSAGSNLLKFRALGIENEDKEIIMFSDGVLNFTLSESLEQLDEVVVVGDIYKNIEETAGAAQEIDSEESKTVPLVLGERDVLKVATALPGISTAGEGATGFNVRGGRADQNLFLLDGATVYNPQHFFGIFSAINPFSTGKVSIYKGPIPAKFGGRLSSVFDISSKEGSTDEIRGEMSIGPVTGNLVLEAPIVKDKASLLVGGRGAFANWILRSLDDEDLKNSEAAFYDVMATYSHKIDEKNRIKATGYFSRDNFSITSDSLFSYDNALASMNWQHKFNDKNLVDVHLSHSRYGFNIEYERGANDDFNLGYRIDETNAKLNFSYLKNSRFKVNYGLESKLYAVDPGTIEPLNDNSSVQARSVEQERAQESALFASTNLEVSSKFAVDLGIRYSFFAALGAGTQREYQEGLPRNEATVSATREFDQNEVIETYGGPEWRVGTRYLLSPSLSIKAGYDRAIQYIHILTNNTTVSPVDTWKLSDLNIEPQRGEQFTLGMFKNFGANNYELSLEGFYKTSDNVLDFKTGADLLINENVETEVLQGEGLSYGLEFLIRKNSGRLNGWLGYTYSRSFLKLDSEFPEERVNDGDFFPSNFDRPHDLSLVANYKLTRRFSLSANFVYQTGRPVTVPVGNFTFNDSEFAVFSDRNSFRIPDFYRLDIGLNVEGNHKLRKTGHSFWTFSIYNVLGRNNPYSVFFVTENGDVKALQSSIFAIPVPSLTYNLKF